jgi:hypothetical protein
VLLVREQLSDPGKVAEPETDRRDPPHRWRVAGWVQNMADTPPLPCERVSEKSAEHWHCVAIVIEYVAVQGQHAPAVRVVASHPSRLE